ncbi:hypothetical protein N7523_003260 [Penicillium sp. IBT 18751x]|nr:hypothetical protein N7523_003260 [Penicillium sp. IBT 18751x]
MSTNAGNTAGRCSNKRLRLRSRTWLLLRIVIRHFYNHEHLLALFGEGFVAGCAFAGDSPVKDSTGTDTKAFNIEISLKDLGPLNRALDYCTLATACQFAFEDRGPPELQDQVGQLLEHLAKQGPIADIVDVEMAGQALMSHQEEVAPPTEGHVGVHFNNAQSCLIGKLACDWLLYPENSDLDREMNEGLAFLA